MRADLAGVRDLKLAISNSSPLILYARIGRLEILNTLFDEVLIPPAVWHEVVTEGAGRSGEQAIRKTEWIRRVQLPVPEILPPISFLDSGEAEVLALASLHRPNIPLLLDDRRARLVAMNLGFPVIGSGGILVRAKEAGALTSVRPVLIELLAAGLFMSDTTVSTLLEVADES